MQLPIEKLSAGVKAMAPKLQGPLEAGNDAAKAIMTTDTKEKEVAVEIEVGGKTVTIGGMCKGSGMIHPNMSTMLGFVLSDAAIESPLLAQALSDAIGDSFNMISVDGDTSTNDMVTVLANGCAENAVITDAKSEDYQRFAAALKEVCVSLAKQIVADGEGATKLFAVKVLNAPTTRDAKTIARAVTSSSLVKAAMYGRDATWGRIACAAGYSGALFDPDKMDIFIGDLLVAQHGQGLAFDEDKALAILSEKTIEVTIDLHEGNGEAIGWGCDLTHDYVSINADYRS